MSARTKQIARSQDRFAQAEQELLDEIPRWRFKKRAKVRLNAQRVRAANEAAIEAERCRRAAKPPRALRGIVGGKR